MLKDICQKWYLFVLGLTHTEYVLLVIRQGIQLLLEAMSRMCKSELVVGQKGGCWSSSLCVSRPQSSLLQSPQHEFAHSFNNCSWVTATWTWSMGYLRHVYVGSRCKLEKTSIQSTDSETRMLEESNVVFTVLSHSIVFLTHLLCKHEQWGMYVFGLFLFGLSLTIPSDSKNNMAD